LIVPSIVLALAALMVASCGEHNLPTSPSLTTAPMGQQPTVTELWVDLVDPTPPSSGPERFRLLDEPDPPPPPGSKPSPWPPGPPPRAQPGKPVPDSPSTHERLHVKIDPDAEGVPHSGRPVGIYSCRDNRFTWYYDQIIATDTGVPVKITLRENFFDGRFVNQSGDSFQIAGNSSVVLHTRWCSAIPRPHFTQHRLKGADDYGKEIIFNSPYIALLSP
jgi:hypothetical protein